MSAKVIDGRRIAETVQAKVQQEIVRLTSDGARIPGLAVIMVGDDPASALYVRNKERACEQVGIHSYHLGLPDTCSKSELTDHIQRLNQDANIDGILLQLPIPSALDSDNLLEQINPDKDIDGFHPYNLGRLAQRRPTLRPCTPYGIIRLLEESSLPVRGLHAVVVGSSNIVGRPLMLELLNSAATVTNCHRFTRDLAAHVQQADLLVVAIGQPGVIQSEWIKPGAIVIDVGINRNKQGKLIGDIDFISASERAAWITPVPGGVGPMTIAMLLENTLTSYKKHMS